MVISKYVLGAAVIFTLGALLSCRFGSVIPVVVALGAIAWLPRSAAQHVVIEEEGDDIAVRNEPLSGEDTEAAATLLKLVSEARNAAEAQQIVDRMKVDNAVHKRHVAEAERMVARMKGRVVNLPTDEEWKQMWR